MINNAAPERDSVSRYIEIDPPDIAKDPSDIELDSQDIDKNTSEIELNSQTIK